MADDRSTPPAPRPRRRRTDIDPNAPAPPVANERRRARMVADQPTIAPFIAAGALAAEAALAGDAMRRDAAAGTEPTPADSASAIAAAAGIAAVGAGAAATARGAGAGGAGAPTDAPNDATAPFRVPGAAAAAVATRPAAPEPRSTVDTDPGRAWLSRLDDRSLDPNVCPFLRAAVDGRLAVPVEQPDPVNRCAALAEAVPQSLRQQELVCLSSGHVNCPRYLRGAAVVVETPMPAVRPGRVLSAPIFASLVLLVMAVSAAGAFALARGGADMTAAGPLTSPSAVAVGPSPTAAPVVSPSIGIGEASPSLAVVPTPTPAITPTPSTSPKPTPAPTPKSDRYKLLRSCGTPKCWIYKVRRGDNLFSIAHFFGVSANSIYARNPWLRQTGLRAGQELRLPPPTR